MANTNIRVTELDFQNIRNNLKTFLSSQTQFQDFNFEGSSMAVLLDLLSYNTHYNSFYTNMLANEMFLDTAQQRDSVVSRASELGYVPVSAIGATANVSVAFSGIANTVNNFTIPKNSKFSSTLDDIQYTFVTPEAYNVSRDFRDNSFTARNITIKEGVPITHKFTAPNKYIIPNELVDTTSIVVKVESGGTTTEFIRATNIKEIYETSEIYFLEESFDSKYEILFGNGAIGKKINDGDIVTIEYLVCSSDAGNGADTFSVDTLNINTNYTDATITVNKSANGGRAPETIESIKFNAPKQFQTQNRAVIDNDYERILLNENPDIQSVTAFGGEKADPPVFGKVFIAVKPFNEQFITATRKQQMRLSISNRTPLAIDPVFIDAEYTFIIPQIKTFYDKSKTTDSVGDIEQSVRDAVGVFSQENLERFGNRLRYSKFVRALDNISSGEILNNDAKIIMQKRFVPNVSQKTKYKLDFNNSVRPNSVFSTQFVQNDFVCEFGDDGVGNVIIFRYNDENKKTTVNRNAGTVDYNTGVVEINSFAPNSFSGIELKFSISPEQFDIVPVREQILVINKQDAEIKVIGESV